MIRLQPGAEPPVVRDQVADTVEQILEQIRNTDAYPRLLAALRARERLPGLALPRAVRLPILAALHYDLQVPLLLITDRADHALALSDELRFWLEHRPLLFAEPNPLFYEDESWGTSTRRHRLEVLLALRAYRAGEQPPVVITSARSLMSRTLPPAAFDGACLHLKPGQKPGLQRLVGQWVRSGYRRANTVLEAGQYSHRGGLLDIWPLHDDLPSRLDFFGDEIESISRFDPATQRTTAGLGELLVPPAHEYLLGRETDEDVTERWIPILHPDAECLLAYLPGEALVVLDDLGTIETMVGEVEEQALSLRAEALEEGNLPEGSPAPYVTWPEIADQLQDRLAIEFGHSTAPVDREDTLAAAFSHDERFGGRLKPLADFVVALLERGDPTYLISRQAARLRELMHERLPENDRLRPVFVESSLSEGFAVGTSSGVNVHVITDAEVFGWERPQPRTRPRQGAQAPESNYADLEPGDFVVHVDHGIGRFAGLVDRELEGQAREFLAIEYADGGSLFVPVHQADRLTRYLGPDGGTPTLDRLGGQAWQETKERVSGAVHQVAQELLELYARRHVVEGYAFKADTAWQRELEDSFPYVETDDQRRALLEIKRDMEAARPMDRLLCGDVGYGKTEVALRAAFKSVMDGRQAAVLVPTTVLAQQHHETFLQRLAAFPVKVEMLSRFRSAREQDAILRQLASGEIDIVVGTHRLISSDVNFRDLGLVIIDEEQRFGVAHKEHLKKLRTEVDVLTLTATPIPRTLYMALAGVRDISNLNTPPEERLSIVTHVGPYSTRIVRQAVLRELERGGQVFFVHNRVHTIEAMRAHLQQLVPEARVGIGHGQMPEAELAEVMHRFNAGEIDILLSTSIIESGLDIPNANTLIVDRADTFGLAQLYQLRGRVGRGATRAYAYFFRHRKISPTVDGQQRLEVIAENTQLGAGYSIAMRDLEIRGAGELLGTRQHGHIAAVGFHLYTRLLADGVRRLRQVNGEQAALPTGPEQPLFTQPVAMPVNVDLPLPVGIPADYISDKVLRLRLYRRIADLRDEAEVEALVGEFRDRFGEPPDMVKNLFYQIRVKIRAERAGLAGVSWDNGQFVLRYPAPVNGKPHRNLPEVGPGVRPGKSAYWCSFGEGAEWQQRLLAVLALLPAAWGN